MKIFIGLFISISFFFVGIKSTEAFFIQSSGGRVLTAPTLSTVCPSVVGGAVTIKSSGVSPTGPYDISTSTNQKNLVIGSWILGTYSPIMTTVCTVTTPAGPVPLPTFPIIKYGTGSILLK